MSVASARVTVGMPVLDNARTLLRAIDSVRSQTFEQWRLIISDDGSSDGTVGLAEAAAAADGRITVLRQEMRLGAMNFRVPLDLATTPYFVWLAGDDHWHPEFLAIAIRALDAAQPAISALPQAAFIGQGDRPIPNLDFLKGDAAGRIRGYLKHPGGTRMYGLMRTDALKAAFPSRPIHAYDWYLMIRLLARGPQLSLPQTLLFREETPWWHYAEVHAAKQPSGLGRMFPLLDMSGQLLRDRALPLGAFPALVRLNLKKHEEIEALTRPDRFQRRLWLYRLLRLPISTSPQRMEFIAALNAPTTGKAPVEVRAPLPAVDVTAILTFRNAARTLGPAIDHLHALGCRVVAVDHGSTDDSRAIAKARLVAPGEDLVDEPWTGTFDLQRQLRLKRQLMEARTSRWILHADADEFLHAPVGQNLGQCLAAAEAADRIAFACDEYLYLPQFEDEEHDSQSFRETMTACVRMQERDAKQRLFRRDTDLSMWFHTAGHTVTRDPARLAGTRLTLRHYPGLSLDDLRAQYLGRVYSPDDQARLWHGNRMAARRFEIVEPEASLFGHAEPSLVNALPFLVERTPEKAISLPERMDVLLLSDGYDASLAMRIAGIVPGLRVVACNVADLGQMRRVVPVLNVLTHPSHLHGRAIPRSLERSRAADWTRRIALARQWAVDRGAPYCELRAEDLAADPVQARNRFLQLWHEPGMRGVAGFVLPDARPVELRPWENPVLAITGLLAGDLGYR